MTAPCCCGPRSAAPCCAASAGARAGRLLPRGQPRVPLSAASELPRSRIIPVSPPARVRRSRHTRPDGRSWPDPLPFADGHFSPDGTTITVSGGLGNWATLHTALFCVSVIPLLWLHGRIPRPLCVLQIERPLPPALPANADVAGQLHHYAPGPRSSLLSRAPYDQFLSTGEAARPHMHFSGAAPHSGWLPAWSQRIPGGIRHCWAPLTPAPPLCSSSPLPPSHTDYSPLLRDLQHNVLDAETQQPPHVLTGAPRRACRPLAFGLRAAAAASPPPCPASPPTLHSRGFPARRA